MKGQAMELNVKALAAAAAIIWGAAVLLVGAADIAWPGYGRAFLSLLGGIYPGYAASGSLGDLLVGTLYGLADGAVCGLVFGWLYNRLSAWRNETAPVRQADRQTPVEP
jgi:hypothetical protein